jgi:hypothetical protein
VVRRTKVLAVLTILALILVVAVPAIAQVTQAPTETFVSGSNTNTPGTVTSTGDNSSTCSAQENFNNSGGVLNQPSVQQYATKSNSGGIEFLAPALTNTISQTTPCEPTVQQAASSSSGPGYTVPLYSTPQ